MSASKIVCRVGQAKNDKGDIIVTTKSGGKGTSTVSFKLLKPEKIGIFLAHIRSVFFATFYLKGTQLYMCVCLKGIHPPQGDLQLFWKSRVYK